MVVQRKPIQMELQQEEVLLSLAKAGNDAAMVELYRRAHQKYAHLTGQAITVKEASDQYGYDAASWRQLIRQGRIRVLKAGAHGRGNVAELDAADVSVFWELYEQLRGEGYLLSKIYRAATQVAA